MSCFIHTLSKNDKCALQLPDCNCKTLVDLIFQSIFFKSLKNVSIPFDMVTIQIQTLTIL
uniref:Uncharacterized protein n=1 Tax=Anguilla anguilla TaxID=7936 RepID=A0A0E9WW90_ANGAN